MKITLKTILSYVAMFIAGMYGLCLLDGELDMFLILGCVVSITLSIVCAPFVFETRNKK